MTRIFGRATLLIAAMLFAAPINAQTSDPEFAPKKIRIVLGAAPGQDYDLWARLIARYLPAHLPGKPSIIVENMPGGGHLIATNWLYNIAPRDGTVWGMVSRNIPGQAFLKLNTARFDPLRFSWIGSPELTNRGCFSMARSGVLQADQILTRELLTGGTGAGSAVSQTPTLLAGLLGMKFKVIEGYEKPQDVVRAMEGGEIDGVCQTVQSFMRERQDWFKSGTARVLFTMERKPVAGLAAPTIYEFAKTDEQRQILDYFSSSIELGRPMLLPPGVPAARVALIRRAFDATMSDPYLFTEANKLGLDPSLRTGEELEEFIRSAAGASKKVIEETARLTGGILN